MHVVAIRVADVMLHMADDDVLPVAKIKRAIGGEDGIGWPEILVAAHQQAARFIFGAGSIRVLAKDGKLITRWHAPHGSGLGVAVKVILLDSQKANHVANE